MIGVILERDLAADLRAKIMNGCKPDAASTAEAGAGGCGHAIGEEEKTERLTIKGIQTASPGHLFHLVPGYALAVIPNDEVNRPAQVLGMNFKKCCGCLLKILG